MSHHEDEKKAPSSISDSALEAGIPRLGFATKIELETEEDAHLGVKTVEAAEKVYGRYSKWFLFVGCVPRFLSTTRRVRPNPVAAQYRPRVLHLLSGWHDDVQLPRLCHLVL